MLASGANRPDAGWEGLAGRHRHQNQRHAKRPAISIFHPLSQGAPSLTSRPESTDIPAWPVEYGGADRAEEAVFPRRSASDSRGPPWQKIGDIDRRPVQPNACQHPVKQLACGTNKGQSNTVLITTGSLTNDHHTRPRIAITEDQIASRVLECAALKLLERSAKVGERCDGGQIIRGRLNQR